MSAIETQSTPPVQKSKDNNQKSEKADSSSTSTTQNPSWLKYIITKIISLPKNTSGKTILQRFINFFNPDSSENSCLKYIINDKMSQWGDIEHAWKNNKGELGEKHGKTMGANVILWWRKQYNKLSELKPPHLNNVNTMTRIITKLIFVLAICMERAMTKRIKGKYFQSCCIVLQEYNDLLSKKYQKKFYSFFNISKHDKIKLFEKQLKNRMEIFDLLSEKDEDHIHRGGGGGAANCIKYIIIIIEKFIRDAILGPSFADTATAMMKRAENSPVLNFFTP